MKRMCFCQSVMIGMLFSMMSVQMSFAENVEKKPFPLSVGAIVPAEELEAVGTIPGCTATLVSQDIVLTAAHCVCRNNNGNNQCVSRSNFTLHNVFPVDDASTSVNESATRRDITLQGTVHVHPEYEDKGWLREDLAIVILDQPVYQVALNVQLISIAQPHDVPKKGDKLTLVGYGVTGPGCKKPSKGKMKLELPVHSIDGGHIRFKYDNKHACPGDSGGPTINSQGRVVGVASWTNSSDESTYRPTHSSYAWIFSIPKVVENGVCSWKGIQKSGINSHQKGSPWCASGSLLTALDLDGDTRYSATDAPVVGSARCCNMDKAYKSCNWVSVSNSHQKGSAWCSQGSFITSIDLDGGRSALDYPTVGGAQCCKVSNRWGKCLWVEVGALRSHQSGSNWCPAGTYLTALDQDSLGRGRAHDSPIIGKAMCCSTSD